MKKFFCILAFTLFFSLSIFAQSETEKGVELYRSGNYDEAVLILEKSVETDKKDRKAWTYLGASYAKKGVKNKATDAFKKAASISVSKDALIQINDGLLIKEKPRPSYTDLARANNTQGFVKFAVEFGSDGNIKSAFLIQALPNGLTENTIEVLKKIKFEPAQKDGKPISVVAIIEYSFAIY